MYLHVLGCVENSQTNRELRKPPFPKLLEVLLCFLSTVGLMKLREGTKTAGPTLGTS